MSVLRQTVVFTEDMRLRITSHDRDSDSLQPARSFICFTYSGAGEEVSIYVNYSRAKDLAKGILDRLEGMKYKD